MYIKILFFNTRFSTCFLSYPELSLVYVLMFIFILMNTFLTRGFTVAIFFFIFFHYLTLNFHSSVFQDDFQVLAKVIKLNLSRILRTRGSSFKCIKVNSSFKKHSVTRHI